MTYLRIAPEQSLVWCLFKCVSRQWKTEDITLELESAEWSPTTIVIMSCHWTFWLLFRCTQSFVICRSWPWRFAMNYLFVRHNHGGHSSVCCTPGVGSWTLDWRTTVEMREQEPWLVLPTLSDSSFPPATPCSSVSPAPLRPSDPRLCLGHQSHLLRLSPPYPPCLPGSSALHIHLGLQHHLLHHRRSAPWSHQPFLHNGCVPSCSSYSKSFMSLPWLLPQFSPPWL